MFPQKKKQELFKEVNQLILEIMMAAPLRKKNLLHVVNKNLFYFITSRCYI